MAAACAASGPWQRRSSSPCFCLSSQTVSRAQEAFPLLIFRAALKKQAQEGSCNTAAPGARALPPHSARRRGPETQGAQRGGKHARTHARVVLCLCILLPANPVFPQPAPAQALQRGQESSFQTSLAQNPLLGASGEACRVKHRTPYSHRQTAFEKPVPANTRDSLPLTPFRSAQSLSSCNWTFCVWLSLAPPQDTGASVSLKSAHQSPGRPARLETPHPHRRCEGLRQGAARSRGRSAQWQPPLDRSQSPRISGAPQRKGATQESPGPVLEGQDPSPRFSTLWRQGSITEMPLKPLAKPLPQAPLVPTASEQDQGCWAGQCVPTATRGKALTTWLVRAPPSAPRPTLRKG